METLVLKIGGSTLESLPQAFYKHVHELTRTNNVIIVHGGGPAINDALEKNAIEATFHQGLRVTTPEVLQTCEMVLSGQTNKYLVTKLQEQHVAAFGLSGIDGELLQAKLADQTGALGLVGDIAHVNKQMITMLLANNYVPVISPISMTKEKQKLNVNADSAAAAIAKAMQAKLVFVTNIKGVMSKQKEIIPFLSKKAIEVAITDGTISGGMIPKVKAALSCIESGVQESIILDSESLIGLATHTACGTSIRLEEASYV
ncbi:acetylglutamate kinase [Paenalkalicoccus suaedae]|uniref:Acetylglutamate kinase n=1 Tax=Paenalkalicoccus suaedae TaxID=2592382 RepID=A0A859FF62_9BACI|nr:acetylglutamate kinase [Paenalkalicoccus suaedae]QKS71224.1 acetylglutamate kinase [Paenalkalicoccus suaedae]